MTVQAYDLGTNITICFGVFNTLVMIFQCTPVDYFWTSWTGETSGTCIDINVMFCTSFFLSPFRSTVVLYGWWADLNRITIVSCLRLHANINPSIKNVLF